MPLALVFSSPFAAFVAAGVLLPLAAVLVAERRAAWARRRLRLNPPSLRGRLAAVVALVLLAALVGVAAAQPTVRTANRRLVRTDAQAMFVVDTSRSMLASSERAGQTRFARVRAAAQHLRIDLPEIPTGIASFTDRVLPLVLPTADESVFSSVLDKTLAVDSPPPQARSVEATTFSTLTDLVVGRYFVPSIKRRLAVVFTDGESRPVDDASIARTLRDAHVLGPIFVRVGGSKERVYDAQGVPEPEYRPDPTSGARLTALARAVGTDVYGPGEMAAAAAEAKRLLGSGPVVTRGQETGSLSLAPYAILAALAPLAFLLWNRNIR
jgi:von Willebrand factor type A domain